VSPLVTGAQLALSIALLAQVHDGDGVRTVIGGWPSGLGITLVGDPLAAIMLVLASGTLLAVLLFAIGQLEDVEEKRFFHPLYQILGAGIALAFLTGDLFNLFVAFEMMLTASYVLMTLGGRRDQIRAGMTYVVISLVASTLFITALALLYAATGTVNMADLAVKMANLPSSLRSAFAVLLLVVFGIKAAIFPLFFWLPDSYPTAPSPVTAVFAGLLTKVGVYAIIRTQTLLFPGDSQPATLLVWVAGLTMVVGVLGAIAQDDVKRILSFNIVSHIGYMIMGLSLFTVAGLAAAVLYTVHHIVAKTALFLTGGLIEHIGGSSALRRLGGMVTTAPALAVLFLVPALSLSGIPPLSGFVAKFALVDAGMASEQYALVAVSLAVSLLTLFSMLKIWSAVFWAPVTEGPERPTHPAGALGGPALMVLPTATLLVISVAIAVFAGPLLRLAERAAADLLDPGGYVTTVLGP
jgi:multicomponent Na+:H+ antiporter subunit D